MKILWCILAALIVAPLAFGQNEDKEAEKTLKKAEEAAKNMGMSVPDARKLFEENARQEAAEKAAEKRRHEEVVAKYSKSAALPDWAPKTPQFTASGRATIKTIDEQEKIVVTGTSPLSPNALADAWDTFKSEKFRHERTGSDINGQVTQIVTHSSMENPLEAVRMEAERKPGEKATRVTLSSPLLEQEESLDDHLSEEMSEPEAPNPAGASKPAENSRAPAPAPTVDLPVGSAKGSLTYEGATAQLKFASAFVDQKDERKPVIVLVTDQKLPVEKWKSEFDMMRDQTKWNGLVFFVDKEGSIYRTDVHTKGRQASVSGIFDVNLGKPQAKDFAGTAKASESEKETKLDVMFHAAVK
ncbi:MAG: hypothetical protein ABI925_10060 [Verrucomicrobiota bacterium]